MRETSTEKFSANATEKANPASAPRTSKEKASPSFFKGRRRKGTPRFLETSCKTPRVCFALTPFGSSVKTNSTEEEETKHFETERREFIYKLAISQGAVIGNIERAIIAKNNKVQQTEE